MQNYECSNEGSETSFKSNENDCPKGKQNIPKISFENQRFDRHFAEVNLHMSNISKYILKNRFLYIYI